MSGLAALAATSLGVASIALSAVASGLYSLPLHAYALAGTTVFLASGLPITPAGIGVGEAAFNFICHAIEASPTIVAYGSIVLIHRLINTTVCGLGVVTGPLLLGRKLTRHMEPEAPPPSA
jgi:uncharacterized membrane protein YbhN (UPF0104 family)